MVLEPISRPQSIGSHKAVRVDVQCIDAEHEATPLAGYLAKYAVKTAGGDPSMATRFNALHEIELARIRPHARQMALCAWDLGRDPQLEHLHLRRHAHNLGFGGHLISKSRGFTTTFGALRGARATFMERDQGA
jgi:hypothetical protein